MSERPRPVAAAPADPTATARRPDGAAQALVTATDAARRAARLHDSACALLDRADALLASSARRLTLP